MKPSKNPAAVALGRLGGSVNSRAQNEARKRNGKLGGWPKGRPRKNKTAAGKGPGRKGEQVA